MCPSLTATAWQLRYQDGYWWHLVNWLILGRSHRALLLITSCNSIKRTSLTQRHDNIVHNFARHTQYAGGLATVEVSHLSDQNKKRPDLQILLPGGHYLSDVKVVHATCPSHVAKYAGTQFAAARAGQKEKIKKYEDIAKTQSSTFYPVCGRDVWNIHRRERTTNQPHHFHLCRTSTTMGTKRGQERVPRIHCHRSSKGKCNGHVWRAFQSKQNNTQHDQRSPSVWLIAGLTRCNII